MRLTGVIVAVFVVVRVWQVRMGMREQLSEPRTVIVRVAVNMIVSMVVVMNVFTMMVPDSAGSRSPDERRPHTGHKQTCNRS